MFAMEGSLVVATSQYGIMSAFAKGILDLMSCFGADAALKVHLYVSFRRSFISICVPLGICFVVSGSLNRETDYLLREGHEL